MIVQSRYLDAANCFISVGGTRFAYRELGPRGGVPLVLLNHWGAILDNFDARIVDSLATRHHVIAVNYRGIGLSGGSAPVTIDEMARAQLADLVVVELVLRAAPAPADDADVHRVRALVEQAAARLQAAGAELVDALDAGLDLGL